jgi:septal ring factor EnvC (AmiA/AmiB activator)
VKFIEASFSQDQHADITTHQQPIIGLVYQAGQIIERHPNDFSSDQLSDLKRISSDLGERYDKVQKESEMRLRRLTAAESELEKFEEELSTYNNWLDSAEDTLRGLQRSVGDLAKLSQQREQHKVLFDCSTEYLLLLFRFCRNSLRR